MSSTQINALGDFRDAVVQRQEKNQFISYVTAAILIFLLGWALVSWWQNRQLPKIEAIALVENSVVVIGPAESVAPDGAMEFCPGDTMTIRYQLAIDGEGTIYADDAASHGNQTVKFSQIWRDVVVTGVRPYENPWDIPSHPDMPIDGQSEWVSGLYTRTISVQASNLYVSRYVKPATFPVVFRMKSKSDCP